MALTRQEVIDEAMRLIDADSLDALTLRALAARAGSAERRLCTGTSRTRSELLDALADSIMDDAIDALPDAPPGGASGRGGSSLRLCQLRREQCSRIRTEPGSFLGPATR